MERAGLQVPASELERVLAVSERLVVSGAPLDKKAETELLRVGRALPAEVLTETLFAIRSLKLRPGRLKGKLLVVTGVDKSGKETQCFNPGKMRGIKPIKKFLTETGHRVLTVALPSYDTVLGSMVGAYLGREAWGTRIEGVLSQEYAWILWSLDRGQHNGKVIQWLQAGGDRLVLAKRWTESNVIYQKANGLDEQRVLRFERNLVKPAVLIVLDIPVNMVFDRIRQNRGLRDRYEDIIFLRKVQHLFLNLPNYYPYGDVYLVDASRPPQLVNADIINLLKKLGL